MPTPPGPSRAVPQDRNYDSDSDSSASDPLDLTADAGWEDVEPDTLDDMVVSLFSDKEFPNVQSMQDDCKEHFNFDLVRVRKEFDLDFLGTIKLVNYIRTQVRDGNSKPDVSSSALFEDEKYLKPVLEDDALLYNLDDILADGSEDAENASTSEPTGARRIQDLEVELERLRGEFAEYKMIVKRNLDKELGDAAVASGTAESSNRGYQQAESGYFTSYSHNSIHETMLKDAVRTDAYRDFIYDNKSLFKDKVVLDVGCGTGILSMFCAKAGAKMVIAVDNSDIIDKAKEIVYTNGLGDIVKCIRGKIEEVQLPVPKVDIIISEWMGYCLLFEAMFDSIIWARDHYLAPDGLLVPSHATLEIAPISDPDLIDSSITFWKSVYGFDMSNMLLNIHDEAMVRSTKASTVVAKSSTFLKLPLHTITVEELSFIKDFSVTLSEDIDALDGWAVWFDIFFMPSNKSIVPDDVVPSDMKKQGIVAFTTGPDGPETHWQQGVFLINREKKAGKPLKKGQVITGQIEYRKKDEKSRCLDVKIQWDATELETGVQEWSLS
ncbi:hypothetical protein AJ80_09232 [Polytolypa hystricis UAMH7299]|uniref:type I protein arginine methyltransferase n=1 Tax=Polytolypa hystricis (strain UAMH7299) TaxID=1447883 RepID=A0A2B7WU99_POLH7|nr:hypothetical protein AJ80_09232 [Polytolypa hystricis UAMH7299]